MKKGEDERPGAEAVEVGDVDVFGPRVREQGGRRAGLDEDRGQKDQEEDRDADRGQPEERAAEGLVQSYPILLISVNIGRYMAMTMPPMTTPRMKIMTGSSSLTSPATAMSTSSS
jgi:hypothetical protein